MYKDFYYTLHKELVAVNARYIELTNKRTTWEDIVTGLWERVEELEKVEVPSNIDAFNREIDHAYVAYDEALEIEHEMDEELEALEEQIELLKKLKEYYK